MTHGTDALKMPGTACICHPGSPPEFARASAGWEYGASMRFGGMGVRGGPF